MGEGPYNRHPLPTLLAVWLGSVVLVLLLMFVVEAAAYAYRQIGVSETAFFGVLFGSLIGGAINIPLARLHDKPVAEEREIPIFGVRYRVPVTREPEESILAINVGGAIIPTALSVVLLVKDDIGWQAAAATAIVTLVVHLIAKPQPGVGITVPGIIPPLLAAGAAVLIDPHHAAAVAYVAGTLGTLIGADLLNIPRLNELGGGVVSIGGAGTFDGVFLSGLVAVLLVAIR